MIRKEGTAHKVDHRERNTRESTVFERVHFHPSRGERGSAVWRGTVRLHLSTQLVNYGQLTSGGPSPRGIARVQRTCRERRKVLFRSSGTGVR